MKVLHCCLANFYIDDYGYQENILPRMHARQGHSVEILASTETYIENRVLGYRDPGSYYTKEGIRVTRIPYRAGIPLAIARKIRLYEGVYEVLEAFSPDVLFLHDCQFLSIRTIAQYARRHPAVRIFVDGHTDYINSARSFLSRHLLHGILYRYCAKVIEPYTRTFYGVLPLRVEFFQQMYGIPPEKTALLVLGAEDAESKLVEQNSIRASVREALKIDDRAFVVVSGGKLDRRKNTHVLMQAIANLQRFSINLILFGTPSVEMESQIQALSQHSNIKYIGWVNSDEIYRYLLASDLGVFPGTHSVLWEQAVGFGLPCAFRRWHGIEHLDVGGNCVFLEAGTQEEIEGIIVRLFQDREAYTAMKQAAMDKGVKEFSYYEIARKAIQS